MKELIAKFIIRSYFAFTLYSVSEFYYIKVPNYILLIYDMFNIITLFMEYRRRKKEEEIIKLVDTFVIKCTELMFEHKEIFTSMEYKSYMDICLKLSRFSISEKILFYQNYTRKKDFIFIVNQL